MSTEKQGSSKGALQCRVKLLDGTDFHLDLDKKEIGQFVFDQVLRRLGLTDKDKEYFGLEYEDDQKVTQWLDLQKQVKKQLKKSPFTLMFKVKHYPLDPVPHPSCRTHFYRQFRRDLISLKMRCPMHNIPEVVASILQADMGDFESLDQDIEFMTDERLMIDPSLESAAVQDEVVKLHRLHKGTTPKDAVKTFLRKVRELETYGVIWFDVKYEESHCQLGLSPNGVSLFRRNRRVFIHDWLMVSQVSFKTKKFMLLVEKESGGEQQLTFELDSIKSSKELWIACREYAEFYTEPRRRIKEEPDPQTQNLMSPGAQGTGTDDHFDLPAKPQASELNQNDATDFIDSSQKVRSLPRYLPTSNDSIEAALRLNRSRKGGSTSPEHVTGTSTSTSAPSSSPPHADSAVGLPRQLEQNRLAQVQPMPSQQQSYDQNQWSHDQPTENAVHYDSLSCRDDYLAQVRAQQMQEETNIQVPVAISDTNQLPTTRSHSTINPDDLSQEQDDMDGSLLDLADELGFQEEESPRTGQNRLQVEAATTNGYSSIHESPHRRGDRHDGYKSYTLPHSFPSGGRSPRQQSGGSPRQRMDWSPQQRRGGSGDDETGPPKPPRTDYPHSPKSKHNGAVIEGKSPYLPGSSFTTGRQHQKKRHLVRTWVQEQQLRNYQSSSSQDSTSAHGSLANVHHRQPSSPDMRGDGRQNGLLSAPPGSAGLTRKFSGGSPPQQRSHDMQHHSQGSSPSRERSRDQQGRPSSASPAHPPRSSHSPQRVQPAKPVSQLQSFPPHQIHQDTVTGSIPPARQHDKVPSDSPPIQSYRQSTSETVTHLQKDPQVPVLIQEIDDLMGGLMDTPPPVHKQSPLTPTSTTIPSFEQPCPRGTESEHPMRARGSPTKHSDDEVFTSEIPFPRNINPADFMRDDDIKIDPRNFLNTPSPEPILVDMEGATSLSSSVEAARRIAYQRSPLAGGTLSHRLQEAMDEEADYHNPPPPPPHLRALTQGFKGAHGGDEIPVNKTKKQLPSVAPKPQLSSGAQGQIHEPRKRPGKEPYDASNLPPEIASFVTRVRNRSFDGGESSTSLGAQHGRQASAELPPRPSNEKPMDVRPSSAVERSQRMPIEIPSTYDIPRSSVSPTFDPLKVEVSAQSHQQAPSPATVEIVTITPDAQKPRDKERNVPPHQNGRPDSTEMSPTSDSYHSAAVYPEAYHLSAGKHSDQPRHGIEPDSVASSAEPDGQQPVSTMYTYSQYLQSNQQKREQNMRQQQFASQNPQLPPAIASWDTDRMKHEAVPQQLPHQQYQLRSQTAASSASASKNKSVSLPRGQAPMYRGSPHHESHGSSDGSMPTTPHAQGEQAQSVRTQPRSPTGGAPADSFGYRYQQYDSNSRNQPHPPPPPHHQTGPGYYPAPQDIRRAQTFSLGQGASRPTRPLPYHRHPGGEDSLPNSPTYFAQNPPQFQNRQMLSPNTVSNNRSFQEHLDNLNTSRHGRKMRVLDWMQKQQQVEHHHMVKDPATEFPTQPYQKQAHIYASAAELDPPVQVPISVEQKRPRSAQVLVQGGYQTQEHSQLHTFSHGYTTAQSQWPPAQARSQVDRGGWSYINVPPHAGTHFPPQPPMGARGNVARGPQATNTPVNAQSLPSAKFEKGYYILDV